VTFSKFDSTVDDFGVNLGTGHTGKQVLVDRTPALDLTTAAEPGHIRQNDESAPSDFINDLIDATADSAPDILFDEAADGNRLRLQMTWEILQSGTSCWQSQHDATKPAGTGGGGGEGAGEEVEVPAAPLLPSSPAPLLPSPLRGR